MAQSHETPDRSTTRLAALLAAGVLVLVAVVGAATQAHDAERAGVTAVDAVVLGGAAADATARLAWRAADGRTAVAALAVGPGARTDDAVRVFVRPDGSPSTAPPTGAGSAATVLATLVAGVGAAAAVLVAHRAACRRRRRNSLAREWARVEPWWSGREPAGAEES